jgi:hypothetical protein
MMTAMMMMMMMMMMPLQICVHITFMTSPGSFSKGTMLRHTFVKLLCMYGAHGFS